MRPLEKKAVGGHLSLSSASQACSRASGFVSSLCMGSPPTNLVPAPHQQGRKPEAALHCCPPVQLLAVRHAGLPTP